jgi:hypothetical protein
MWWMRELLGRKRLQFHNRNSVTLASRELHLLWERGCVMLPVAELLRHYKKLSSYFQHYSGVHAPVGNSNTLSKDIFLAALVSKV